MFFFGGNLGKACKIGTSFIYLAYCSFQSSNGAWGRVFKITFNQKLESITRKITLKLVSLPSLRLFP